MDIFDKYALFADRHEKLLGWAPTRSRSGSTTCTRRPRPTSTGGRPSSPAPTTISA